MKEELMEKLTLAIDPQNGMKYLCIHEKFSMCLENNDFIEFAIIECDENELELYKKACDKIYKKFLLLQKEFELINNRLNDEKAYLNRKFLPEYIELPWDLTEKEILQNIEDKRTMGFGRHATHFSNIVLDFKHKTWHRSCG